MMLEERLLACREVSDSGCWIWTGSTNSAGYGQLWVEGRNRAVHRLAAYLWLGFDLSSPLCVLHECDTPRCFNPQHLFVGTKKDNTEDMVAKGRHRYALPTMKPPELVATALSHVDAGESLREAARRVGVSHTAVQKWHRDRAHQM